MGTLMVLALLLCGVLLAVRAIVKGRAGCSCGGCTGDCRNCGKK